MDEGPALGVNRMPRLHHAAPMSYYPLEAVLVQNSLARRASFREPHLDTCARSQCCRGGSLEGGRPSPAGGWLRP